MKKFIAVTREQREKLIRIFGCTGRMIEFALAFDSKKGQSDLARRIRKAAREMGCLTHVVHAETECFYDSEGTMHQPFPNGAHIELYKDSGEGVIIHKGNIVARYENVKVAEIPAIQALAAAL